MSAPERIWAYETPDGDTGWLSDPTHGQATGSIEFVRADIADSQLAEVRAKGNDWSLEADKYKRALDRKVNEKIAEVQARKAAEAECDRLVADNARLRAALEQIAVIMPVSNCDSGSMARSRMKDIARNAIRAMGEKK